MSVEKREFGKKWNEMPIYELIIKNSKGCSVSVITFGACVKNICVPDKNHQMRDVCIGFSELDTYTGDENGCAGAVIGRVGGRIAGGSFDLDGKTYTLTKNNGENTLHSGNKGFDKRVWAIKGCTENSVTLNLISEDGDQGFPGMLSVDVTYTFDEDNILTFTYDAVSDRKTLCDITNHSYFNLNGHASGDILDHTLCVYADKILDVGTDLIPSGRFLEAASVPFRFTGEKSIGHVIQASSECQNVAFHKGIDTNYCNGNCNEMKLIATLSSPESGIAMDVLTDQPSVHIYTGMCLNFPGKEHSYYKPYAGVAMLTEHYTDSVHHAEFPSYVLEAGKKYHTETKYCFTNLA